MGVNGIYGLSGSGLDVESMVKVGMLSKKSEYEKMQQKYTKDEWKKSEFLNLYGEIQTFNASTLSQYKMSSNMNSRSASSANSSAVTATANANAATMTHYVEVQGLASSAYLIGTNSPTRLNTAADQKTQLSSVLFESLKKIDGSTDTAVFKLNGSETRVALSDVAFSFSINDGVNGLLTSTNSEAVVASASPDAATGTYKVEIDNVATAPSFGAKFANTKPQTKVSEFLNSVFIDNNQNLANVQLYLGQQVEQTNTNPVFEFTIGDSESNTKTISYNYSEMATLLNGETTMADFVDQLNEKIGDNISVKASISNDGTLSFTNANLGPDSQIIIEIATDKLNPNKNVGDISANVATPEYFDLLATRILNKLVNQDTSSQALTGNFVSQFADGTEAYGIPSKITISGTNAKGTISKLNADGEADTTKELNFKLNEGTYNGTDTDDFAGITVTAKKGTNGKSVKITNDKSSTISVTYRELLEGFTFYDLTSKVNSMGLNVRFNYDSVQDRFSIYNKKSGEENKINIQIGTDALNNDNNNPKEYAAANAAKFFDQLGFKQSSNGEIVGDALSFAQGSNVTQKGVNAYAKVDGIEYKLDSNNVSVDGVTYNLQNVTANTGKVAVTVTQDIDSIVKNVQSFVDDYNALLTKLYKLYDEKPNTDYKPLTETQKSGMKEEQIEKWEEKAKAGMLYHDKTLGQIITDLRSAVSENVSGVNGKYTNIFSIGVSTTGLKGQLTLDKDKLKAALAEDPDAVYNVFAKLDGGEKQYKWEKTDSNGNRLGEYIWTTNSVEDSSKYKPALDEKKEQITQIIERASYNGIAQRLGDIFMKSMKSVKAVSGSTADITEDSELNNLMRELQTKMSNFKRMMQAFESRLYKKYDAMESSLALLGSQLNYVTSAFQ